MRPPKIGLALGSGGAKGLAHIGVIKVLEEQNIPIDYIVGSSIGAFVGGVYAVTRDTKRMEEIALSTTWRDVLSTLFEPSLKKGLVGGKKAQALIEKYVDGKSFEDCIIPFAAVATDLKTGETVVLKEGKISPAVRASISIPLVFKPTEMGGRLLADGGLSAPVPVEIVRSMGADIVIAVNLDKHYYDEDREPGWYDIANDSLNILRHHLAVLNTENADIVIETDLGKESWFQFVNGRSKILSGEEAMRRRLPQLRELMHRKANSGLKRYLHMLRGVS